MPGQYLEMSSVWTTSASLSTYPALAGDLHVDAAIIGGGLTGATTAYLLKQAGLRVAVIERRRCGGGETGRTSAHVTTVPDVSFRALIDRLGVQGARSVWEATFAALTRVRSIVRDERIHCDFGWVDGWLHASAGETRERGSQRLRDELAAAQAIGMHAFYVDTVPGMDRPAICFEHQARVHPLRYLGVLLDCVNGDGSVVVEHTPVDAIEQSPWALRCGDHRVTAKAVVIATHEPFMTGHATDALLQAHVQRRRTYLVGGLAPRGAFAEGLYWEQREGDYEHLRIDRGENYDEVLFGGLDHASTEADQSLDARDRLMSLEHTLRERMPGVRITRRWSGHVFETSDGLPVIGEAVAGRFVATGFGGNGLTFGTLAAMLNADAILDRANPWRDLFDLHRLAATDAPGSSVGAQPVTRWAERSFLACGSPCFVT